MIQSSQAALVAKLVVHEQRECSFPVVEHAEAIRDANQAIARDRVTYAEQRRCRRDW
jgi:hypothetical protein